MSFKWDWDEVREATSERERRCNRRRRDDDDCYDIKACDRSASKSFEVSVPVTVTPYALPGEPDVSCGGEPRVRRGHRRRPCRGNSHDFTISQTITVDIPIEFGARVCYEEYCSEERGSCVD